MGDGTGSTPPGPDRSATPALPPGGGRLMSGHKWQVRDALVRARPGRDSARLSPAPGPAAAEQALQELDCAWLGQWLVAVSAFGRLNAGRAACRALAAGDGLRCRLEPVPGRPEAALGEA